jgi:hypothetical protein
MHTRLQRQICRITATLLATPAMVVALIAPTAVMADPPDHVRHGPGERDFRDSGHSGGDFRGDHGRVPRVRTVGVLPRHYDVAVHNGLRFYYGGGLWYSNDRPGRYAVVAPPLGIVVRLLPPFYSTMYVGPTPYYYANSTYYMQVPQGYAVVAPPTRIAAVAPQAPVAPRAPTPEEFFVYPRQGQDLAQQAADRQECNEWATGQTAYDPRFGLAADDDQAPRKRADYRRALDACLDGRGYTMK